TAGEKQFLGKVEREDRLHAMEADPVPQLGAGEHPQAARMAEKLTGRRLVTQSSGHPGPPLPEEAPKCVRMQPSAGSASSRQAPVAPQQAVGEWRPGADLHAGEAEARGDPVVAGLD